MLMNWPGLRCAAGYLFTKMELRLDDDLAVELQDEWFAEWTAQQQAAREASSGKLGAPKRVRGRDAVLRQEGLLL